jgi:hypothetical protein
MRLTVRERKKAVAIVAPRYQKAQKKDKGVILNEFIELTGYGRRYASYVLRNHGKKVRINERNSCRAISESAPRGRGIVSMTTRS